MREEIIKLLDQYRLKEALSQMTGYATHTSDWQLKNELEALQTGRPYPYSRTGNTKLRSLL